MNCGELASRPPVTIAVDATLEEAIQKLASHRIGLLVVVDKVDPTRPLGVVSERDVIKALAKKMPMDTTVDKVGTMHNFIYVFSDDPITTAAMKMKRHGVRHVVVLDRGGKLYGVISIRDLIGEKKILEMLARETVPYKE